MKLIESGKFHSLLYPTALADMEADGFQRLSVSIDPNGIGFTEAEMLQMVSEGSITLRFNQNELANAYGRQSVSVKVI